MTSTTCFRCVSAIVSRLSRFGVPMFADQRTAAVPLIFLHVFENEDMYFTLWRASMHTSCCVTLGARC